MFKQKEGSDGEDEQEQELKVPEIYMEAMEQVENLIENIKSVRGLAWRLTFDVTALDYFDRALTNFERAHAELTTALEESPEAFIKKWVEGKENPDAVEVEEEDMKVYQSLREGGRFVFRAMQVANMVSWWGNIIQLDLWKAYEIRRNIRQLSLDLLRMPITLKGVYEENGKDFGPVAKQIITFSAEDDLDNGLPDIDVYPFGATSVGTGGVSFEPEHDGKISEWDDHFSSIQVDNGTFSKICSYFVYDTSDMTNDEKSKANSVLNTFGVASWENKMCDILYGEDDYELKENEIGGRVTYRKFFHISF